MRAQLKKTEGLPATTTCIKQGITDVTEADCGYACQALGMKYTGARARPNMTSCFAITSGQYKGNCNYNTNATAGCPNPPCYIYGSLEQQLCVRK